MLLDSTVTAVRTRPRAIPLAIIIMRKFTHGFPYEYGAPLGGPSGRRSSAMITHQNLKIWETLETVLSHLKCISCRVTIT